MSGCTSSNDADDGSGSGTYTGDRTLEGTVDTSSLSAQDQAETRSRSRMSRADGDEIVRLYVVDANGSYEDTGIECTVSAGDYSCPNIAGDQEYIVRYVKDLGDGRILEMKTSATVEDVDVDIDVSPITTMIVETLMTAIQEAISGLTADATLIADIIESVKTAIVDTITTLIQTGVIQVPTLVADGNFTAIQAESVVSDVDNSGLDDIAAIVTTNEDVSVNIDAIQNEAAGSEFSDFNSTQRMEAVFDVIGWNEDMPPWVLNMFSSEYSNMDANWTIGWLIGKSVLIPNAADDIERLEDFTRIDPSYDAATVAGFATTIAGKINPKLTDGTMFTELKTQVVKYHTIKAKGITDRTAAEMAFLADFPSVVGEIFPSDFASTMTTATPMQNMGQMFLILGYLDVYSGKIGEMINAELKLLMGTNISFDGQIKDLGESLFSDDGGEFIMEMYTETELAQYDLVSVSWMRGETNDMWNDATKTQSTALRLSTGISKMSWDLGDGMTAAEAAAITGVLNYPKADGTRANVDLKYYDMHGHSFFGVMPMIANPDFDPSAPRDGNNMDWIPNPVASQIVTDFVSGDYTVTFTYDGASYTRTQKIFFVQDAYQYNAELISPKAMPQWNQEWDNIHDWSTVTDAAMIAEHDAFEEANIAYWANGVPTFAPNADGDTKLHGMLIKWKAPDLAGLVLPENIQLAYNVNVRQYTSPTEDKNQDGNIDWNDCGEHGSDCNIDIYNTWGDGKQITTTSMTLPVDLAVNPEGSNYELSVDVMFIDEDTGGEVARGGWNNAQFRVGASLALTGTEVVTFAGTFELETGAVMPTDMKVALYGETWGETTDASGNTYWDTNRTKIVLGTVDASAKTFTVDATWNQIKDHIGMNKSIQVIAFDDTSGDGVWQDWEAEAADGTYIGEPSYWLHDTWMHIDSWGDTTIRVGHYNPETDDHTEESTRLKTDTNATIDGLHIKIW